MQMKSMEHMREVTLNLLTVTEILLLGQSLSEKCNMSAFKMQDIIF